MHCRKNVASYLLALLRQALVEKLHRTKQEIKAAAWAETFGVYRRGLNDYQYYFGISLS